MRWAEPDPIDAPRYGHMEPAYDSGGIQRRRITKAETAAIAERDARPPVLVVAPPRQPYVIHPHPDELRDRPEPPEPEEVEPVTIAAVPEPADAPRELDTVGDTLEEISSLAANARAAWQTVAEARASLRIAEERWDECKAELAIAYGQLGIPVGAALEATVPVELPAPVSSNGKRAHRRTKPAVPGERRTGHTAKHTVAELVDALRTHRSYERAGKALGVTGASIRLRLSSAIANGEVGEDVVALVRGRARGGRPKKA